MKNGASHQYAKGWLDPLFTEGTQPDCKLALAALAPDDQQLQHQKGLCILHVEDDLMDRELSARVILREVPTCEFVYAATEKEFRDALHGCEVDLILSDISLPTFGGSEALEIAKARATDIPFIFVSGTFGEERAVESLKSGGTDYVLKTHLDRLPGVITRALREAKQIEERTRAERALRESEQRYRALVDNAPTGIFIYIDEKFTYVNEAFCRILGARSPEQLLGSPVFDRFHPVFHEAIRRRLEHVQTKNEAVPLMDQRYIRLDGSIVEVETTAAPISYQGKAAIQVVVNDVTHRSLADAALRASEERFRQLAENIEEVFWLTDPKKSTMLYISPGYEQLWGRTCQSLYADPDSWLESIHHEDRKRVLHASATGQALGKYDEEYRILRPDGEVRTIRDRAFPIRDASGEVYRIAGVAQDITDRTRLEEQVRHAQKMESFGQLAGGVAHDFNNILTVIQMQSSLLLENELLCPETLKSIQDIASASERATNLTRQLLTFSRRQTRQPRNVDLNDLVGNMTRFLRRILGENITLESHFGSNLPLVHADLGMMEQVVMNLAVNARDAISRHGRLIVNIDSVALNNDQLANRPNARQGTFVRLTVADTGCGIPAEHLPRIFEPFFTTKEVGKGTGLGLATVHGIVKQHDGWLELESAVGVGTTFRIFLPALEATATAIVAIETPAVRGGKETILLVEDEPDLRFLARTVLEQYGYSVLEAEQGTDALKHWRESNGRIDLLITDLVIPGSFTGRELAAQLRVAQPALKVLYVSGYSPEVAGQHLDPEFSNNFLQKPFASQTLAEAVRRCLDLEQKSSSTKTQKS